MDLSERFRGALLGLAVGDALGTTLEFKRPGTFVPISTITGGGPFDLEPGQWTDDTAMALCLAESLLERGSFHPSDQMLRYVSWYRTGHLSCTGTCFDIGKTTKAALERFEQTFEPLSGSTDPRSAGNGSLMRLAPIPLFYAHEPEKAIDKAGDSSKTTHGARAAVDACRYMAALIVGALQGATKKELVSARFSPANGYWRHAPLTRSIDEVAAGSFRRAEPPEIAGTGYVVQSLEAALWAFHRSATFREGMLKAVNLGDDADTTGAIYGQLAGAFYGASGIPAEWLEPLAMRQTITDFADRLYARVEVEAQAIA
jgi:ADP-ribosylglycohydrolase